MAICEARIVGLWYGRTWPSVRNLMFFVRAAHSPQSANGFAEIENFGKKKCSMMPYAS